VTDPDPRRHRARAALGVLGLITLACAHQVAPTGGPVDESPPQVSETRPALYATNVPRDQRLEIVFSERVDRGRAEDGVIVRPQVDWDEIYWREDTLVFVPRDGWADSTTYTVLVRTSVVDRRRNEMAEPALTLFSTGPGVHGGQVTGTVRRIGVSTGLTTIVAFDAPVADTADVDLDRAVSVAEPDAQGRFLLPGLELGRTYEVGAAFDVRGDRAFDAGQDLYCRVLTPVVPDTGGGPGDLEIVLVFPDEPGRIEGVVIDSTCRALGELRARRFALVDSTLAARDSLLALRATWTARVDSLLGEAVAPSAPDTANAPAARAEALRARADSLRAASEALVIPDSQAVASRARLSEPERADSLYCVLPVRARFAAVGDTTVAEATLGGTDGAYRIVSLPPGTYSGHVWRDLDPDERYDPGREPGSRDSLRFWVAPGRTAIPDTVRIRRPGGWEPPRSPPPDATPHEPEAAP